MFKYNMGILPYPINNLFALKSERHNYNTRQTHDLQINAGRGEIVYNCLVIMMYIYGIIYLKKNPIDVSYACFKNLTKTYLQTNDILYRAR